MEHREKEMIPTRSSHEVSLKGWEVGQAAMVKASPRRGKLNKDTKVINGGIWALILQKAPHCLNQSEDKIRNIARHYNPSNPETMIGTDALNPQKEG